MLATMRGVPANTASIIGTTGRIDLGAGWWQGTDLTVHRAGQEPESFSWPENGTLGYQYEIAAVGDAIRAGKLESEVMPLQETVAIMALMDDIRASWGLRYPADGQE